MAHAPSLVLEYDDETSGDILTQDVWVPEYGLTQSTYYCCLQWNAGDNGGGYCGIQDNTNGRSFIFSLWEPKNAWWQLLRKKGKVQPVYKGTGTECETFDGEGRGLKSMNFTLGWDPDSWYTFVTRRWGDTKRTYFGLWVKQQSKGTWTHVVTMEFPIESIYYSTTACFLEDWQGTGQNQRAVRYKNAFKRKKGDKEWIPLKQAKFRITSGKISKNYKNNFDAGTVDGAFYLQSGGTTKPTAGLKHGHTLTREMTRGMKDYPDEPAIQLKNVKIKEDCITWDVPTDSVPQFRYVVMVDGRPVKEEVNAEVRAYRFESPTDAAKVQLEVEDLYGRSTRVPEGR